FAVAATFSGSGFAPSFSGAQNTPATVSPRARKASSTALPKSCCPTIAIFIWLCGDFLRRGGEGPRALEAGDLRLVVLEDFLEDLLGMLAERRAALDDRGRSRELDRHADVEPLAALRMVELDPHVASLDVLVGGEVLGRHDRPARHVEGIQDRHELALRVLVREL